jgi:hypothetical protein
VPLKSARAGAEWNFTVLPNASVRYRGEGKVIPQSYVNRFAGISSPVYRLEASQAPLPAGYWSAALFHTGVFGGGAYAEERVPDNTTQGVYQINQLNVGFTNLFITYHRPVKGWPVEALAGFSVVREIFKRKSFVLQGVDLRAGALDDVNEISAEGLGFGLSGVHGNRAYLRWQAMAHYYAQLFDAKTDASAGQIWQMEGGVGVKPWRGLRLEGGYFSQYWFTLSQGDRRIAVPGTNGFIISWNRNETRVSGGYVRLAYDFGGREE